MTATRPSAPPVPVPAPGRGPLAGLRVLDLSRVLAGPLCAAHLGDLGAEVTKVEVPRGGDDSRHFTPHVNGESSYFMLVNRGKRSITLDLKSERGRALLHRLVERADVLVENFRPGVTSRLGIDYQTASALNPRLVYVSISGFGQDGPLSARPAYDHVVQAMGGIMAVTGWPDGPPTRIGDAVGDVVAGLHGAFGALAALRERDTTGRGQHVDVAMLDAIFSLQAVTLSQVLAGRPVPQRQGNGHPISAPMDSYPAADGHVVIAVANDALFARLATALGRPDLVSDARFATDPARLAHRRELREVIEAWTSTLDVDGVVTALETAGVPAAPIWDAAQLAESEHAEHRGLVHTVQHPVAGEVLAVTQPVRFSSLGHDGATGGTTVGARPAPVLGQHTDEVLSVDLGLSADEIAALRAEGVL